MLEVHNISIANICFTLSGAHAVQPEDAKYSEFFNCSPAGETVFPVQIIASRAPDLQKAQPLFSSTEGWSMYWLDGERVAVSHPPTFKEPVWICRLVEELRVAKIHCGISEIVAPNMVRNPMRYPLDCILTMYALSSLHGLIFHSAGAMFQGRGFILAGKSGAGKSTLSRNLLQCGDVGLLSDDRMIIRKAENGFVVHGTPWAGEAEIARNVTVPLGGIFFIHQGAENRIEKLSDRDALEQCLPLVSIPWYDRPVVTPYLDICSEVIKTIPCFHLICTAEAEAGRMLVEYFEKNLLG